MTFPRLWSSQERMLRPRSSTGSSPRSNPAFTSKPQVFSYCITIVYTGCNDVFLYFLCISSAQRILIACKLKTPLVEPWTRQILVGCVEQLNRLTVLISWFPTGRVIALHALLLFSSPWACNDAPYRSYTPYSIALGSRRGISSVIRPFGGLVQRGALDFLPELNWSEPRYCTACALARPAWRLMSRWVMPTKGNGTGSYIQVVRCSLR